MGKTSTSLGKILRHLKISNSNLAKSIIVDASLISRWINGQRQLKLSSDNLNRLTDYLMDKILRTNNADWLKRQMEADGFALKCVSSADLQKALKIWLSSDGDDVSKTLNLLQTNENSKENPISKPDNNVKNGYAEIAAFLEAMLGSLPDDAEMDIHISNEGSGLLLDDDTHKILLRAILTKKIRVRMIISLTSNTVAVSRLLSLYMQPVIEGLLSISVAHNMMQTIMNQSIFIIGDELILIVCETQRSMAPPIGTVSYDEDFLEETRKSFERVHISSQPLLHRYNDDYSRKVLDLFYQEYAVPGNLDVIKDNINPLCMEMEEYSLALKLFGNEGEQLKWRMAEFCIFKGGMDKNLENGVIFREMLSLKRLKQIAEDGICKMPALYFINTGIAYLDAPGCYSIIEGYIRYLMRTPNFQVIVLDEMSDLNEHCCWHLKQNLSITINGWNEDENIILYSDQLILTHEFQTTYDKLWNKENYSEGCRKKTIGILQEISEKLKANHNL